MHVEGHTQTSTISSSEYQNLPVDIGIGVCGEYIEIPVGLGTYSFHAPHAMSVTEVRGNVNVPASGTEIRIDIRKAVAGTSWFRPDYELTIDPNDYSSTTAATAAQLSAELTLSDDERILVDVLNVGASAAGKGLKLWIKGNK